MLIIKTGINKNNHYTNLEWVTRSENTLHAYHVLKVQHSRPNLGKKGILNHRSLPVIQIDISTNQEINKFVSITEAAEMLNIKTSGICAVLSNRNKTAGGFKWKYA